MSLCAASVTKSCVLGAIDSAWFTPVFSGIDWAKAGAVATIARSAADARIVAVFMELLRKDVSSENGRRPLPLPFSGGCTFPDDPHRDGLCSRCLRLLIVMPQRHQRIAFGIVGGDAAVRQIE